MISGWMIYGIMLLDSFVVLFCILCVVFAIGALLSAIITVVGSDDTDASEFKMGAKYLKRCVIGFSVSLLIGTFIPSTNQMALIYVIPKMSNSEFMKTIPAKLELLANKELDSLLKKDDGK